MTNQNSREIFYYKIPMFIVDLCIHLLVLKYLVLTMDKGYFFGLLHDGEMPLSVYTLLGISFSVAIGVVGLRLHERRIRGRVVVWRAFRQTMLTYAVFTMLLAMVLKMTPRMMLIYQAGLSLPLIVIAHICANRMVRWFRHIGHNTRTVVIVGTEDVAFELYDELIEGQTFRGYRIQGFFGLERKDKMPAGSRLIGSVRDFHEWIKTHRPDEIYCTLEPGLYERDVNKIIRVCNEQFIEFFFVPSFKGYPKRRMMVRSIGGVKFIKLHEEPMNSPAAKIYKRTMDVVVSGLFLCTAYPLVVLFVWLGNKITGNVGPLYFRQARTGYNGKSFYIYKFRSMKVNKDADKVQATKDDPRKTPFGDFLRRSSIDELPQFINVFIGDMSVIGPRPHMEYHTEMYSRLIGDYMVRHLAKPGITGWAQINGCRGETKTVEEMENRVKHDIWYIEHWTPLLDIEIIFKTVWQVMPGHDKQAY